MDSLRADEPTGAGNRLERTGDDAVDQVLQRLDALPPDTSPAEQAAVLEVAHEQLQQRLAAAER